MRLKPLEAPFRDIGHYDGGLAVNKGWLGRLAPERIDNTAIKRLCSVEGPHALHVHLTGPRLHSPLESLSLVTQCLREAGP